jgi:hypothetical protein
VEVLLATAAVERHRLGDEDDADEIETAAHHEVAVHHEDAQPFAARQREVALRVGDHRDGFL